MSEDVNNLSTSQKISEADPSDLEAKYRDLALRMAIHPNDPRIKEPQLFLGKLPPDLPFELPLPVGSNVIGTLIRSPQHIEMVLDCSQTPESVIEFYTERLTVTGWQKFEQPIGGRSGGFTVSLRGPVISMLFCRGNRGPALNVQAFIGQQTLTELRLNLSADSQNSPCNQKQQYRPPYENLIPPLSPPAGIQQLGGGGGGGSNSWYSSATLETDLNLATLATYYASQLEKGGWTKRDEGQSGPIAWNTWDFKDSDGENWQATFFILRNSDVSRQHFLYIKADLAEGGQNNGGQINFTNWIVGKSGR